MGDKSGSKRVTDNQLKGNFGAAYVASLLAGAGCLVRPVGEGTDFGIDLYCETVENESPFLHFWVQVKTGDQCRVAENGKSATCPLERKHLDYWLRQPVPVFVALVAVCWPLVELTPVYVVDLTLRFLEAVQRANPVGETKEVGLTSDYVWEPNRQEDVMRFVSEKVPLASASLQVRLGVVGHVPTLEPSYERMAPVVPVLPFQVPILHRLRTTAAHSVYFLHRLGQLDTDPVFRKKLAAVAEQVDDGHWESPMAQALSCHADGRFDDAVRFYENASASIRGDGRLTLTGFWEGKLAEIGRLLESASNKRPINASEKPGPCEKSGSRRGDNEDPPPPEKTGPRGGDRE